jgi:hypothetical protein
MKKKKKTMWFAKEISAFANCDLGNHSDTEEPLKSIKYY